MTTLATLFTGGDGFGIGAKAAGLKPLWGVEINPVIADWAERNTPGLNVIKASVTDVDYTSLERPYWLHMSPVCKNASVAKQGGEAVEDLEMARGCIMAIEALQPPVVSLENVYPYREFQAFKSILGALHQSGYAFDYWHLNSADFGVPQTRKRLILIARKDSKPMAPAQTHCEGGQAAGLFGAGLLPWVGWYEAIEDLIPGLPESQFAPWQLERLPEELKSNFFFNNQTGFDNGLFSVDGVAPSPTVVSTSKTTSAYRAFIVDGDGNRSRSPTVLDKDEPGMTVTAWHGRRPVQMPRSYIERQEELEYVERLNKAEGEQMFSTAGRVVAMTPRALARFQSVPDAYHLPDKKSLACEIIGNMVPPLLAQNIVRSQL